MKQCVRCGATKDFSEFYAAKRMKDGYSSWCKQCKAAHRKASYAANKEREYAKHREWVAENLERRRAQNLAATKRWGENNPAVVQCHKRNHKDKRRAQEQSGGITPAEWLEVLVTYGDKCLCCGADEVTMDHVVPLSVGGSHTADNVQPLCGSCNSRKSTKTIDYRRL